MNPTTADPRLRELVERHRMTYRVQSELGADPNWKQQRIGFELELHCPAHPDAAAAMREIAEWVLADGNDVCVSMDTPKGRTQQATGSAGWLLELRAHVLHCGDVRRPVDGGVQQFMQKVKSRLASLDMAER